MHEGNEAAATIPAPTRDVLSEILRDGAQPLVWRRRLTPRWASGSTGMPKLWMTPVAARWFATGIIRAARFSRALERLKSANPGCMTAGSRARTMTVRRSIWLGGRSSGFRSSILPPYLRKTKAVEELIPWLYLKGVSTGDFREAFAGVGWSTGCRPERHNNHTADRHMAAGLCGVEPTLTGRSAVRLCVGRWYPLQHPARRRSPVHSGADGRDAGRQKGADRRGGRPIARAEQSWASVAAGLQAAWPGR